MTSRIFSTTEAPHRYNAVQATAHGRACYRVQPAARESGLDFKRRRAQGTANSQQSVNNFTAPPTGSGSGYLGHLPNADAVTRLLDCAFPRDPAYRQLLATVTEAAEADQGAMPIRAELALQRARHLARQLIRDRYGAQLDWRGH